MFCHIFCNVLLSRVEVFFVNFEAAHNYDNIISSTVRVSSSWQAQLILVSICWKLGLWTQMSFCSPPTLVPIKTQVVPFCYFILKKKSFYLPVYYNPVSQFGEFCCFFLCTHLNEWLISPFSSSPPSPPKKQNKKKTNNCLWDLGWAISQGQHSYRS